MTRDWEDGKWQILRENFAPLEKNNIDILYHYRTLDGFWKILESEQFWATNARYSNDQEEQSIGLEMYNQSKKKILDTMIDEKKQGNDGSSENIEDLENQKNTKDVPDDCYIICFCKTDDKLSQWRAYADGGVSMGLEVANIRSYDIQTYAAGEYVKYINTALPVFYLTKKEKFEDIFGDDQEKRIILSKGLKMIPYIKHAGFKEEEEYRLVFYNKDETENNYIDLHNCVKYRNQGDIKIPYIIVDFKTTPEKKGFIRVSGEKSKSIYDLITEKIKPTENLNIIDCFNGKYHDSECENCVSKEFYNPDYTEEYFPEACGYLRGTAVIKKRKYLVKGIMNNSVMIPNVKNQQAIFNKVDSIIKEWNKNNPEKYFVWVDGHIPIRTIRVGPCRNQEEIYLSIKHYCSNHYWLKYVIVEKSETPYRKSLL